MTDPQSNSPDRSLDDILDAGEIDAGDRADSRRLLATLRGRREPLVSVALLKTLGVAFGVLAALIGIAGVVVAAIHLEGWGLWAGTLGGVALIFLGAIFALVQVALASLVDTSHQAVERLNDLVLARPPAADSRTGGDSEQIALLRQIRDATLLTEEQRAARLMEKRRQAIEAAVHIVEKHIDAGEFGDAGTALRELAEAYPDAAEVGELDVRLSEAETAAGEAAYLDLAATVRAALEAQAWTEATAVAEELVQRFPDHPSARELAETAQRRSEEATAGERAHLYERITGLAREHQWREALDLTSDLIERFPESEEAGRLRPRIGALADKAEVVERRRLLAAVRSESGLQNWAKAYGAARDLINAYPDSEEATEIFRDLPNLRRLAKRT